MIGGIVSGLVIIGVLAYFLILYFKPDWLQ
jgi:hypothetical protein